MKMMDNRAYDAGKGMHDSPDSIRRGGGEDPRRREVQIVIDRKIMDHDLSGYNHNGVVAPGNDAEVGYAALKDRKANAMGTPNPDGTYSR